MDKIRRWELKEELEGKIKNKSFLQVLTDELTKSIANDVDIAWFESMIEFAEKKYPKLRKRIKRKVHHSINRQYELNKNDLAFINHVNSCYKNMLELGYNKNKRVVMGKKIFYLPIENEIQLIENKKEV